MSRKTVPDLHAIREQAADWVVRLHTRENITPILPAFSQWLDAEPNHRLEFQRLDMVWEVVQELRHRGVLGEHPPVIPLAAVSRRPLIPPRRWKPAVAFVGMLVVVTSGLLLVPRFQHFRPARLTERPCANSTATPVLDHRVGCKLSNGQYATDYNHTATLELSDGSVISLNYNSQVALDLTNEHRWVRLDRGEGMFQVNKAPPPFEVTVGLSKVRALGTTFSIEKEGPDSAQTVIIEGRVSVLAADRASPIFAETGQVVEIRDGRASLAQAVPSQVDGRASWTAGVLTFDGETLAQVAKQFNRYNRRKLKVDPGIADLHIGGLFASNNPEGFATALERMLGIRHSIRPDPKSGEDVIYLYGMTPTDASQNKPHNMSDRNSFETRQSAAQ